ncbi:hypothetical protein E4T42_06059 [Aureobasidium subglaciale]|nr:hypothetical protein E4T42_06059 [Aureobasidium subglaciale]
MWVHTNCSCRTCAGRNTPSGRFVSPPTLSFDRPFGVDSPPSPVSPALSISSDFDLRSPESPYLIPQDTPLSPVSPISPPSSGRSLGPSTLSLDRLFGVDSPPSPLSPTYSISSDFDFPSPESPYFIPQDVPLSPVSSISPLPPFSPASEYSTAPPSPVLSISELTPGDFPSPATPITDGHVWELCVIPSVRANPSVFTPYWRTDASKPFSFTSQVIKEEEIGPLTSPDAPVLPPCPKRTPPKRPERSPGMKKAFSWNTAKSAIAKAGPCSGATDAVAGAEKKPSLIFTNTPWWDNIPPVSPPDSPAVTMVSFSGFSGNHRLPDLGSPPNSSSSPSFSYRQTPSCFYRKSRYITPPTKPAGSFRNIYWTSDTLKNAAEYAALFGQSVQEDEFAWIRYPVSGPHHLCRFDDEDSVYDEDESFWSDDDDGHDESAHYTNWHDNPTALDLSDPFAEVDAGYSASVLPDDSSIRSSSYSGTAQRKGLAMTAEVMRASYISSYLTRSAIAGIKEVCIEDPRMMSLDAVIQGFA